MFGRNQSWFITTFFHCLLTECLCFMYCEVSINIALRYVDETPHQFSFVFGFLVKFFFRF